MTQTLFFVEEKKYRKNRGKGEINKVIENWTRQGNQALNAPFPKLFISSVLPIPLTNYMYHDQALIIKEASAKVRDKSQCLFLESLV